VELNQLMALHHLRNLHPFVRLSSTSLAFQCDAMTNLMKLVLREFLLQILSCEKFLTRRNKTQATSNKQQSKARWKNEVAN